ncbi:ImmA/IrrE family metallo-endopeptidase [Salmonella enterica subsp. enterica]|jgi:Zn-dependent peptidase ImmA (M78 family)|nr:ImmA/IrrE family metallo-endopeptidase [Salmonella enterica subsp. enterica serovar Enteritidis]
MQLNQSISIVDRVKKVIKRAGSREPEDIAEQLGITIMPVAFSNQKGVYKVIERNRFIFIKEDLCPELRKIVLLHEIGHDVLHRGEAKIFREFNIFDMKNNRMEYEANSFAAEVALPDEEILEYIYEGCDIGVIAKSMYSDINLVALKVANFNRRGYSFRPQDSRSDFLK